MQPLFSKLTPEERSQLIETIYTGTLAINLLLLPCILSTTPDTPSQFELLNLSMGIPAAAGAILTKRTQKQSTWIDRYLGRTAIINSTIGIGILLWHFFPLATITFAICTGLATILVIAAHNAYAPEEDQTPSETSQDNHQEPPSQQRTNTKRRKVRTRSR